MKTFVFPSDKNCRQIFLIVSVAILCTSYKLVLAQQIVLEPDTLNLNVSSAFTLKNTGESRLNYTIESNTSFRTFHSNDLTELNSLPVSAGPSDTAAIPNDAKWVSEISPDNNYSNWYNTYWLSIYRGFEGWASTGENWKVIKNGYFKYYYGGLSDGSSVASGLFSPRVEVGSEMVSSFSMEINFIYSSGTTWQIVPQSLNNNLVVTRFQVNPDQTIQILVADSLGHASFQRINIGLPLGQFHLSMEVDRKTSLFTVFFNGQRVFTGKGFANNVDQVAVLSLNESATASMQVSGVDREIDYPFYLISCNPLVLIAGDSENNYSDLSKVSGYLEPGASVTRSLSFSESDLIPGVYRDSIKIFTNDPINPFVFLPYRVTVERPYVAPADYNEPSRIELELSNDTLEAILYKGDSTTVNVTIKNKGQVAKSIYFPEPLKQQPVPVHHVFSNGSQNFHWTDISTTGTALELGDDDSQTIEIPFSGLITISSNGYLALGAVQADDPNNRQLDDSFTKLNGVFAPYWDDFAPDQFSGIYYQGDDEKFIVQYTNIPFKGTNLRSTFQIIIYNDANIIGEVYYNYPSPSVEFLYLSMHDRQSATIGFSPYNQSIIDLANNEPFVTDSLAILFQPPAVSPEDADSEYQTYSMYPWVHYPEGYSVIVPPNSSRQVPIKITSVTNEWIKDLPIGITKSRIFFLSHPFWGANEYWTWDQYDGAALVLPVKITVLENPPPVIDTITPLTILEGTSVDLSFSATDSNDSTVDVYVDNVPNFITFLHQQNKSITYKIAPAYGDAGEYKLIIRAKDPHGAMDTDTLHLTVSPFHSISNFSLAYFKTGSVVLTFNDSVTLDVADPDIEKYTIRANTVFDKIHSVQFTLDGNIINTDNSAPYTINFWTLPKLSAGAHALSVQGFSKKNSRGDKFEIKEALIHIINSAAITQFDIVDSNGNIIKNLLEGDIINIGDPILNHFNVIAQTNISTTRSVKFILNDITARIDNRVPYGIYGRSNGFETPWPIKPGSFTLTAVPYMHYYGWGPGGVPLTVHFTIVNEIPSTTNARVASEKTIGYEEESLVRNVEINNRTLVYPNPVDDEVHVVLNEIGESDFALRIMSTHGQVLYSFKGNTIYTQEHIIHLAQLGLTSGVYYLEVTDNNGYYEVKKLMKR